MPHHVEHWKCLVYNVRKTHVGCKMEKRYQVFISSTFADLEEERKDVMEAIIELDCFPAGMEMFPASNKEQFEYIKSVIDESDYYVIIVAGKYGSIAEDGLSYTEKEFDYAKEKGIPILAFVKKNIDNLAANKVEMDADKREKLEIFRKKVLEGRLAKFWNTKDELKYNLHSSLSREMKQNPKVGWIRGNTVSDIGLYDKLEQLRDERDRYKQMYLTLKNDAKIKSDKYFDKKQSELENKMEAPFPIEFTSDNQDVANCVKNTSISEILKKIGVILFTQWTAETLKIAIEAICDSHKEGFTLSVASLSNILLKLLALKIIEPMGDLLKDEIELTELGKEVVLSFVEF